MGDTPSVDIIALVISYAARTVLLTLLLWIMVQLQKLNYSFLGLLGSAALASALDTIPYFGHYLAVPVLYLCIWKVTQASLMPDAIFTVVVAYALMFAVNVMLFTALIGDLRPSAMPDANERDEPPPAVLETETPPAPAIPRTNHPPAAIARVDTNAPAKPAKPAKSADEILKAITVKAATDNGAKSLLTISAEKKIYTLTMGQPAAVPLADGVCHLRLVRISESWATVEVNGEATYLRIH